MKKIFLYIILGTFGTFTVSGQNSSDEPILILNETNINSEKLEYSPTFFEDGIAFITNNNEGQKKKFDKKIGEVAMSIFYSKRNDDGTLGVPALFDIEIASPYHEGPLCLDRTAENIYFTRNNINSRGKLIKAKDKISKLGIYSSSKVDGKWSEAIPFNQNNIEFDYGHPSISVDGSVLYFTSNMEGGYGGMDLYMSERSDSGWLAPINLGPTINTSANEVFPYIHADGTLYFSSNGHNSKGGLDIYYSWKENGDWNNPVALGGKMNSIDDDFGIIIDRDKMNGYFSSNRIGGVGVDDIYSFHIQEDYAIDMIGGKNRELLYKTVVLNFGNDKDGNPITNVDITVSEFDENSYSDAITTMDENGNVFLLGAKENGVFVLPHKDSDRKYNSGDDNFIEFKVRKDKKYIVKIEKEGFLEEQLVVDGNSDNQEFDIEMPDKSKCLTLKGTLINELNNGTISGAVIKIRNIIEPDKIETLTTDEDGHFEYCLKCGQEYELVAKGFNGADIGKSISTKTNDCALKDMVELELVIKNEANISQGLVIELPNIYYNFNDASLRPDAVNDIDVVYTLLKNYPSMEIEIGAHTDSRGTNTYNYKLSQRRADIILQYLTNRGILPNRLIAKGYGEDNIRNGCTDGVVCEEDEHQYNRRTEITITKLDKENVKIVTLDDPEGKKDYSAMENGYLVIAGSFLIEENAVFQLAKLMSMGYDDARIVKFSDSQYNGVAVGRFSVKEEAMQLIKELNDKGVITFLKVFTAQR